MWNHTKKTIQMCQTNLNHAKLPLDNSWINELTVEVIPAFSIAQLKLLEASSQKVPQGVRHKDIPPKRSEAEKSY